MTADTSVNASQQSHVSDRSEIATSPEVGNQRRSVMDSPYIRGRYSEMYAGQVGGDCSLGCIYFYFQLHLGMLYRCFRPRLLI